MSSPKRARTERRERQRDLDKAIAAQEKRAGQDLGASPERPLRVQVASSVEARARAMPCPICGGGLDLRDESAEFVGGHQLRRLNVVCRTCRRARALWFAVGNPLPS